MINFFLEKSNTHTKITMIHAIDTELCLDTCNLFCDEGLKKEFFK